MNFKYSIFALFIFGQVAALYAQATRPEPGSVKVPVQNESDEVQGTKTNSLTDDLDSKKSYGYVRVWNFTDGNPERLAAGLLKKGDSAASESQSGNEFVWLGRGMMRSETKSYLPVPIGSYQLVVAPEKVQNFTGTDEENKPLTAQDDVMKGSATLSVLKDQYVTVVLTGDANKIQISEIKDSDIPKQSKQLRAMNFTKEYKPSVASLDGGKPGVIWTEVSGTPVSSNAPSGGMANYEVSFKKPSGSLVRKSLEVSFAGSRSATILMYYDRYGRFACRAVADAPGP